MCYALYLFTDSLNMETSWTEEKREMWVQAVVEGPDLNALKWPHTEKHIYYIGSSLRCGCGWSPVTEYDEAAEILEKQADRKKLVGLLNSMKDKKAWLVICWEGNQGGPLFDPLPVKVVDILDDHFEFEEMRKYTVN